MGRFPIVKILFVVLTLSLGACINHYEFRVSTQLLNTETALVKYEVAVDEPIVIIPHTLELGGDKPSRFHLRFYYREKKISWRGQTIPISFQLHQGTFYLVTLDRESEKLKTGFRYYRFVRDWKEIEQSEYPKAAAVQNLWSYEGASPETGREVPQDIVQAVKAHGPHYTHKQQIQRVNPYSEKFQNSLTAMLWLALDKGVDYDEAKNLSVPANFYEQYFKNNMKFTINIEDLSKTNL